MRDRADFMENLKTVRTLMLILTEDIKYPLEEHEQRFLDAANQCIAYLFNIEMKKDITAVLEKLTTKEAQVALEQMEGNGMVES